MMCERMIKNLLKVEGCMEKVEFTPHRRNKNVMMFDLAF